MKFIIAGYGFVGSAIGELLSKHHEVIPIDPRLNSNKIEDHIDTADGLIIAVSTPPAKNGDCDDSNIWNVLKSAGEGQVDLPILIKSTVTWSSLEKIVEYNKAWNRSNITYYPEFLREATALEDLVNQKYVILGGEYTKYWADILYQVLPLIEHIHSCTIQEASIVKYMANSYLATKVTFFNELFELCNKVDANYDTVSNLLGLDNRIGAGHTVVPGPDGKFGWGGHCFPKDTQALINEAKDLGIDLSLLEKAVELNKVHRKKT
jgi:UDPglucose 6-dehydrogenase